MHKKEKSAKMRFLIYWQGVLEPKFEVLGSRDKGVLKPKFEAWVLFIILCYKHIDAKALGAKVALVFGANINRVHFAVM